MAARVGKGDLPGIVTLVARGDEVHVDVIGTMAFGGDGPIKRNAIFRIASLTKPILATAAMMIAIALTQTDGFLFNGTLTEFDELAAQA